MFRVLTVLFALILIGGCSRLHTQDSSGQSYISNYQADVTKVKKLKKIDGSPTLDERIRKAASIEPILNFPARIGLAKFENGILIDLSDEELSDWKAFTHQHNKLNEFVPINVLGTATVRTWRSGAQSANNLEAIRIAAAKQHMDAILVYEVNSKIRTHSTALSVVDLTIIGGAVLPTRSIEVESNARALLLDVRNGYPYGAASSSSEFTKFSTSWNSREQGVKAKEIGLKDSYEKLFPKIEKIFEELLYEKKPKA